MCLEEAAAAEEERRAASAARPKSLLGARGATEEESEQVEPVEELEARAVHVGWSQGRARRGGFGRLGVAKLRNCD